MGENEPQVEKKDFFDKIKKPHCIFTIIFGIVLSSTALILGIVLNCHTFFVGIPFVVGGILFIGGEHILMKLSVKEKTN